VGLIAKLDSRALGLAATLDPKALDVGLTIRPCHESVITIYKKINIKERNWKKINWKRKKKAKHYFNE
jgi:hypothetical protein